MGDAKVIESAYPLFEFLPIGTTKRNMVEADPELAELLVGYRRHVLVQPDELAVADQVHRVMELGIGVLVKHGLGTEERFVPRHAHRQVADGERDVGDRWKCCHAYSLVGLTVVPAKVTTHH